MTKANRNYGKCKYSNARVWQTHGSLRSLIIGDQAGLSFIPNFKFTKESILFESWSNEFENESESAKCTNSPRVYDLRTPQKKSRMIELMSDTTSDDDDDLFVNKATDKNVDPKTKKPTAPVKLASIPSSKPVVFANYSSKPLVSAKTTGSSFVDQILLEESRRANQTTSGSVVQIRQQQYT